MKVVAPISDVRTIEGLIKAGVDELFCGVIDEEWKQRYPKSMSSNRRTWYEGNLKSFSELKEVVDIAHANGRKVQFCANGYFYLPETEKQLDQAIEAKVDRIVVANIPTLLALRKKRFSGAICISSGASILNAEAVRFFKELGAQTVILTSDLSVEEIVGLVRMDQDMEYEVFIKNEACRNVRGMCDFGHGVRELRDAPFFLQWILWCSRKSAKCGLGAIDVTGKFRNFMLDILYAMMYRTANTPCQFLYRVSQEGGVANKKHLKQVEQYFSRRYDFMNVCGACALIDLMKENVGFCKIAGRGMGNAKTERDVRFIRSVIDTLEHSDMSDGTKVELVLKKHVEIYGYKCNRDCYYQK